MGSYDEQDQHLRFGELSFMYTHHGELFSKCQGSACQHFTYDVFGSLRQVALDNGQVIEYLVDGRNRRVGKKIDGVLVRGWLYDDQLRILAELDGQGNVVARFVYADGINVPELMEKGGRTYRLIKDQLGSVRLVVDIADGTILQEMRYDAWGNVMYDSNPGFQPFGFAGGLYDPQTRLARFGARDYDASVGRWLSKDPLLFPDVLVSGQANVFGYAVNSPLEETDSSGLSILPMGLDCERIAPILLASHNSVCWLAKERGRCKGLIIRRGLYPCFDDFCNPNGPCKAVINCSPPDDDSVCGSWKPMRGPCTGRVRINRSSHGKNSACRDKGGRPPFTTTMFHEYLHACGLHHDDGPFKEIMEACTGVPF